MKTFFRTFTLVALTLIAFLSAAPLKAGGTEVNALEIRMLSSENMIQPGNSIVMDLLIPAKGMAELNVTDVNGRNVWSQNLTCKTGQNRVKFRVGELPPGAYFLKVSSAGNSQTQTFAVR